MTTDPRRNAHAASNLNWHHTGSGDDWVRFFAKARLETVGPTEDGRFLLSTGWPIKPAGTTIPLSTLPMAQALAPDGRVLAALNAGYAPASISLIDLATSRETTRATITDGWRGLVFSPAGDKLYAGGGSRASLAELQVYGASLSVVRKIDLAPGEKPGTPHLITDLVIERNVLVAADQEQDKVWVVDPAAGKVLRSFAVARNPYGLVLTPDGASVFEKLASMHLLGMVEGLKAQEQDPSARELSFLERFGLLVDQQWIWRENQALSRRLKNAKLRTPNACVEEIDYRNE